VGLLVGHDREVRIVGVDEEYGTGPTPDEFSCSMTAKLRKHPLADG
jgi:hypothetical protein